MSRDNERSTVWSTEMQVQVRGSNTAACGVMSVEVEVLAELDSETERGCYHDVSAVSSKNPTLFTYLTYVE